ncbi:Erp family outer-surface lipoprotein [Borreliella bavariensis]|uniref:Erp family outer-surface lipoprotein n=1 Tax=Borreliella bavariensis TaxID=664662 RepID=UPI00165DE78B|nr:Erp family outer-surface lipoprotein [Borreliella bavariensis]
MNNVSEKNQENIQNNIQAKIKFRKDMKTLRMNLPRIDKNSKGYEYNYLSLDKILKEIKNVIKKHNLDLTFGQFPTSIEDQYGIFDVIRTTFYSTSTGYKFSFDTSIHTDKLQYNSENGSEGVGGKTFPQLVGAAITYFRRCALVTYLNIQTDEFFDFTVNIKYKKRNIGDWIDLGTLDVIKEEYVIVTNLNAGGHAVTLFSLEESEINNFVNSMIKGGAFKANYYYGYQEGEYGEYYTNKNIETKIETINGYQFITFLGRDNAYAILLEEFKMNLKRI